MRNSSHRENPSRDSEKSPQDWGDLQIPSGILTFAVYEGGSESSRKIVDISTSFDQ